VGFPRCRFRRRLRGLAAPPTALARPRLWCWDDGSKFVSNWLRSSPTHGVIYALAWWENSAQKNKSTNELFSDFHECNINAFHGNIAGERELDVQGYPAKMTVVFAPNRLIVENLVIRVGPRLYSLSVLDSTGRLDISNIKKFFASLSLHQT
jgi:hypothetical protein